MKDISFDCPECGGSLVVDSSGAGVEIDCPRCRTRIRIPSDFDLPQSLDLNASAQPKRGQFSLVSKSGLAITSLVVVGIAVLATLALPRIQKAQQEHNKRVQAAKEEEDRRQQQDALQKQQEQLQREREEQERLRPRNELIAKLKATKWKPYVPNQTDSELRGISVRKIAELVHRKFPSGKGEFETKANFLNRLQQIKDFEIEDGVRLRDHFFTVENTSSEYRPEEKGLEVSISFKPYYQKSEDKSDFQEGITAMGVKGRYLSRKETIEEASATNSDEFFHIYGVNSKFTIRIEPNEARILKEHIRSVFIWKLDWTALDRFGEADDASGISSLCGKTAVTSYNDLIQKPTLSEPWELYRTCFEIKVILAELWIVDLRQGSILRTFDLEGDQAQEVKRKEEQQRQAIQLLTQRYYQAAKPGNVYNYNWVDPNRKYSLRIQIEFSNSTDVLGEPKYVALVRSTYDDGSGGIHECVPQLAYLQGHGLVLFLKKWSSKKPWSDNGKSLSEAQQQGGYVLNFIGQYLYLIGVDI